MNRHAVIVAAQLALGLCAVGCTPSPEKTCEHFMKLEDDHYEKKKKDKDDDDKKKKDKEDE